MKEKLKQFIVKHSRLRYTCHIHHGMYCNCGKSINISYSLDIFKAIKEATQ